MLILFSCFFFFFCKFVCMYVLFPLTSHALLLISFFCLTSTLQLSLFFLNMRNTMRPCAFGDAWYVCSFYFNLSFHSSKCESKGGGFLFCFCFVFVLSLRVALLPSWVAWFLGSFYVNLSLSLSVARFFLFF
jgi:hypothetical protein